MKKETKKKIIHAEKKKSDEFINVAQYIIYLMKKSEQFTYMKKKKYLKTLLNKN